MKARTKSIKQNISINEIAKPRKKSETKHQTHKHKPSSNTNNQPAYVMKPTGKSTKQHDQAKKYLQKTLTILSHRFNLGATSNLNLNQSSTVLNLSTSVYKIVKENVSTLKRENSNKQNLTPNLAKVKSEVSKIRDQIHKDLDLGNSNNKNSESRRVILSEKEHSQKPRSSSVAGNESILEFSSICHNQSSINGQNVQQSNENSSIFVKRRSNSTLDSYFREKFGTNAQDQEAVQKKLRVIKALKKSQQIVSKSNRSHVQSSMILSHCDLNQKSIVMEKLRGRNSQGQRLK